MRATTLKLKIVAGSILASIVVIVWLLLYKNSALFHLSLEAVESIIVLSPDERIQNSQEPVKISGDTNSQLIAHAGHQAQSKNALLCVGDSHRLLGFAPSKYTALQISLQRYVDELHSPVDKKYAQEYVSGLGMNVSFVSSEVASSTELFSSYYAQDEVEFFELLNKQDREDIKNALDAQDFERIKSIISARPNAIYYAVEFMDEFPSDLRDDIFGTYGFGDVNLLRSAILYQLSVEQIDYLIQFIPNYQDTFVTFGMRINILAMAIWAGDIELMEYFIDKGLHMHEGSALSLEQALMGKYNSLGEKKTGQIVNLLSNHGYQWTESGLKELQGFISPSKDDLQPNESIAKELSELVDLNQVWTRYVVQQYEACSEADSLLPDRAVMELAKAEFARGKSNPEVEQLLSETSKLYTALHRALESERLTVADQANEQLLNNTMELTSTLIANDEYDELTKLFESAETQGVKVNILFAAAFNKISAYDFQHIFADFLSNNPEYIGILGSFNTLRYLEALDVAGIQVKRDYGHDILYSAVEVDAFIVFDYLIADITPPLEESVSLNALEYYILSGKKWDSHREKLLFEKYSAEPGIANISVINRQQ